MEGDRKIPALKLFMSQLDRARQPIDAAVLEVDTNLVGLVLLGVDFTRVWLQVCTTNRQHTPLCQRIPKAFSRSTMAVAPANYDRKQCGINERIMF